MTISQHTTCPPPSPVTVKAAPPLIHVARVYLPSTPARPPLLSNNNTTNKARRLPRNAVVSRRWGSHIRTQARVLKRRMSIRRDGRERSRSPSRGGGYSGVGRVGGRLRRDRGGRIGRSRREGRGSRVGEWRGGRERRFLALSEVGVWAGWWVTGLNMNMNIMSMLGV